VFLGDILKTGRIVTVVGTDHQDKVAVVNQPLDCVLAILGGITDIFLFGTNDLYQGEGLCMPIGLLAKAGSPRSRGLPFASKARPCFPAEPSTPVAAYDEPHPSCARIAVAASIKGCPCARVSNPFVTSNRTLLMKAPS
jgi:hypothetical protein